MEVQCYIPQMSCSSTDMCALPLCVDPCIKEIYRQSMKRGTAFPLESLLSLVISDYNLLEGDDQSCPATKLMTNKCFPFLIPS